MADRYLLESGAPDGYLLEDGSGVLLIEVVPDTFAAFMPAKALRRINTTNRVLRQLEQAEATPATPSNARSLNAAFTTRLERSRKSLVVGWSAALAPSQIRVPDAAWMRPAPKRARDTTCRVRRAVLEAVSYPQTPQIAATFQTGYRNRRETARKLRTASAVPFYPQAAPALSADRSLSVAFTTNVSRSRKFQTALVAPVFPATPLAPVYAATVKPVALKRRTSNRKLRSALLAPVFPATPVATSPDRALVAAFTTNVTRSRKLLTATVQPVYPAASAPVPVAALVRPKVNRRKSGEVGFVSVDALFGGSAVTQAVFPSFKPVGFIRRRETERRLKKALVAPVFPATPAPASRDRTLSAPFTTKIERSRKLLTAPVQPVYTRATPVAALVKSGFYSRRDTERHLVAALPLGKYPNPAAPMAALFRPAVCRRHQERRHLAALLPPLRWIAGEDGDSQGEDQRHIRREFGQDVQREMSQAIAAEYISEVAPENVQSVAREQGITLPRAT